MWGMLAKNILAEILKRSLSLLKIGLPQLWFETRMWGYTCACLGVRGLDPAPRTVDSLRDLGQASSLFRLTCPVDP